MKLDRLVSTTQSPSVDAAERVHHAADVRRVEAPEAVDGDRERSLQQELAEFDPRAAGPSAAGERMREEARAVAEQLANLGDKADDLLRPDLPAGVGKVDESA